MTEIEIQVGRGLRDAAADVASAWKNAESGHQEPVTDRVYIKDWAMLCAVLNPNRYELLRHLRRTPADGILSLAQSLGRDVEPVYEDIAALSALGLVLRAEGGGLSSPFDATMSTTHIAA